MTETAALLAPRPHPAVWSEAVLDAIALRIPLGGPISVLDPFAGVGAGRLGTAIGNPVVGLELEPEWAIADPGTVVGSALAMPFADSTFDLVITSPTYGNRCADSHEAKDDSKRITYRHKLGRMPTEGSSSVMQWGAAYRSFHMKAYKECRRVLKPGGKFILNISDHVRNFEVQPVTAFHVKALRAWGFVPVLPFNKVNTPRMGFGANRDARCEYEYVIELVAP